MSNDTHPAGRERMRTLITPVLTCLLLLGAFPSAGSSQVLLVLLFGDKLSNESMQIGIKLDRAFTSLTELDGADVRSGWAFGAFAEVPLNDTWGLQPELTLTTPGGAQSFVGDPTGNPTLDGVFTEVSVTRKLSYSNLVLPLRARVGRFAIGAGPQIGYLRKAQDIYEGLVSGEDQFTLESDISEGLNSWDVGIAGKVEFLLKPERGMQSARIHVAPYVGLSDMIRDNTGLAVKGWGVSVGIGIPVGTQSDDESNEQE